MNIIINLENLSLFDITPENIKNDPEIKNLIPPIDFQLRQIAKDISKEALIYNIDNLDETVLDFLAVQFHIDFYDLAETLQMKREAVKNSLLWHMRKGTRGAILEALRQIGVDAEFINWPDFGGEPYTFKIKANITGDYYRTAGRNKIIASIKRAVNESKAARSLLTELETHLSFSEILNLFAGNASLLSGNLRVNLAQDTPPEPQKIFAANSEILSGHSIIYPDRERLVKSKLYAGCTIIQNISHDIGIDLDTMQILLEKFEDRIFDRIGENEKRTNEKLDSFEARINEMFEKQNKIMISHFRAVEDLLRWKENDDDGEEISWDEIK